MAVSGEMIKRLMKPTVSFLRRLTSQKERLTVI